VAPATGSRPRVVCVDSRVRPADSRRSLYATCGRRCSFFATGGRRHRGVVCWRRASSPRARETEAPVHQPPNWVRPCHCHVWTLAPRRSARAHAMPSRLRRRSLRTPDGHDARRRRGCRRAGAVATEAGVRAVSPLPLGYCTPGCTSARMQKTPDGRARPAPPTSDHRPRRWRRARRRRQDGEVGSHPPSSAPAQGDCQVVSSGRPRPCGRQSQPLAAVLSYNASFV